MTKSMTNQPCSSSPDLPRWVKPQLCKLVDAPPQGPEWLHEIKHDGYRMHARLDRGRVYLLTRAPAWLDTQISSHSRGPVGSAGKAGVSRWRAMRHYPGWE